MSWKIIFSKLTAAQLTTEYKQVVMVAAKYLKHPLAQSLTSVTEKVNIDNIDLTPLRPLAPLGADRVNN